ncbi:hypothetical protein O3P69_018087 [Scylla paramamosain]|uniref:Uncharacterized protein n=1 Tax=Scylla paramamosain TaxID=85552 RepID=A0AAW0TIK3_SCYPA
MACPNYSQVLFPLSPAIQSTAGENSPPLLSACGSEGESLQRGAVFPGGRRPPGSSGRGKSKAELDLSAVDGAVSGDARDNTDGDADGSAPASLQNETDSVKMSADASLDSEAGDGEGATLTRTLMTRRVKRTIFVLQAQKARMWEGLGSSYSSSLENDERDSVKMTFADRLRGESGGASAAKDVAPDKPPQILPTSARQIKENLRPEKRPWLSRGGRPLLAD